MPQGKGALLRVLQQFEAVFRTAPAAAAFVMPFTTYGVERAPNRQQNNTVNQSALGNKSDKGDPTVAGPIASILELRSVGRWLKGALGAPVTGKAVTSQPVNVTGLTVHYASADCTAGNGTLTYTAIGTTITWTPQGGAAGAPVNIGAGGNFTLLGGGGGKSVRITVVAASLPVGDQIDAAIVVSATLKAHAFPINAAVRPSMLLEAQSSDLVKYYRTLGAMVNTLGWDVLNNDQNLSLGIIAAVEVEPVPGAAFDANPTAYGWVRACSGRGRINDGATGLGTIVSGNIQLNNNMTPYQCADGLEGAGFIDNGELMIGGSIRSVFDGAGAYALARAGTSTRIRMESGVLVGADEFKLVLDALDAELTEKAPPREGKSGLFVEQDWKLHLGTYAPELYLVNDVAAY